MTFINLKKYSCLVFIFLLANHLTFGHIDSVKNEAIRILSLKQKIEQSKLNNINKLKESLRSENNLNSKTKIIYDLILEYRKYQIDSAITYAQLYKQIGESLQNTDIINQSAIFLASFYSSAAKFIESENTLRSIDRMSISDTLLQEYFEAYTDFGSHYGQSSDNILYFKISEVYRDSLLQVLGSQSIKYKITLATKLLYNDNEESAKEILLPLLQQTNDSQPERALIAYLLGIISKNNNQLDDELYFLSISSISDVKNVVKDNASLVSLASLYYNLDQIENAYLFIKEAIDDALFCNIRYRSLETSTFYSIIIDAYQKQENARKNSLTAYLIFISALGVLLLVALIVLYIQIIKLRRIKNDLKNVNNELIQLNNKVSKVNKELSEANLVKEEYIAQFFDLCSSYIDKLDGNRKILLKKFTKNQIDEIGSILKSNDFIKTELDDLYKYFDIIFLNLYPNFITDFNELLRPDEQIILKSDEMLNMELRIFALIRLGITDSSKIANFLRYSLRTVYNYRVKVRNKVAGSKEEFENKIIDIGNIRTI